MIPVVTIAFLIGIGLGILIDRANEYYKPFNPFREHLRNVRKLKMEVEREGNLFYNYLIKLKTKNGTGHYTQLLARAL